MLVVKNLSKVFTQHTALDDLSFEAKSGEVLGLLGLNGAGKSTCLKILSTFLKPTTGEIQLQGICYNKAPNEIRKLLGFVPDNPALYADLKVSEYLYFMGALRQLPSEKIKSAVSNVLNACDLESVAYNLCASLSRGFRQRISIAQAIIHQPRLLILDEPTIGLDPLQIEQLRELLKSISQQVLIIFSSHMLSEVENLCSRVILLEQGKLTADINLDDKSSEFLSQLMLNSSRGRACEQLA